MNLKRISKRLENLSTSLFVASVPRQLPLYSKEELAIIMKRVSLNIDKIQESIDEIIGEE